MTIMPVQGQGPFGGILSGGGGLPGIPGGQIPQPGQQTPMNQMPPQMGGGFLGGVKNFLGNLDPQIMATLGANLLAANAPSRLPMSTGARFGIGLQNALPQIAAIQSSKRQREERKQLIDENTKIAKNILSNLDADQDGTVSPQERQIGEMARLAIANPAEATNILSGIYEKRASMLAPQPAFEGKGIEAQALNRYLESLPPEQRGAAADALVRQRLERPTTTVTPEGTYKQPGYDLAAVLGGQPTEPEFIPKPRPTEQAAKEQMLDTAVQQLPDIESALFNEDGTINRGNLATMQTYGVEPFAVQGIPGTRGRSLAAQYEAGIQAITRGETGAAMPPSEVENTRRRFMPKLADDDATVKIKWAMYQDFLRGNLKLLQIGRGGKPRLDDKAFEDELKRRTGSGPAAPPGNGVVDWGDL